MVFTPREEDKDYWINNYVHRSSPVRFKAPALVRQVAYWYNENDGGIELANDNKVLQAIVAEANKFGLKAPLTRAYLDHIIIDLYNTLTGKFARQTSGTCGSDSGDSVTIRPCVEKTVLLFGKAVAEGCGEIKPLSELRLRQRDIFFNEYRSVTLQFPWQGLGLVTMRFELDAEYFTAFICIELHDSVLKTVATTALSDDIDLAFQQLVRCIKTSMDIPELKTEDPKEFFYDTFWEALANELLATEKIKQYRGHELFGRMFADFRGLILSEAVVRFPNMNLRPAIWGFEAAKKLLPLITEANRWECTASYMLEGRVLHMSALGPQGPEISDDQRAPVTYVLYVQQEGIHNLFGAKTNVGEWQLGRLVDRLHTLGTVRLAALRGLKALREAGDSLARLEFVVKEAREAQIPKDEAESSISSGDLNLIQNAQQHFNSIGTTYYAKTRSATGLMYRVERSRFYVQLFRNNISYLRLVRLEGYQKYDQFVERRLGPSYDFINRLGTRYERASNALQTLYQNYLAVRANKTGQEIENLTLRSIQTGREIEHLQRVAEAALIGFLLPYYIVGSMNHLVGGEEHHTRYTEILSLLLLGTAPAYAYFRQSRASRVLRNIKTVGIFAFAMFAWYTVYISPSVSFSLEDFLSWLFSILPEWLKWIVVQVTGAFREKL
jgi:hypothetical protein